VQALGVFPVTGAYTYVRDGVITTVGPRGCQQAEPIEQVERAPRT
jgi:hypothetical protein